MKKQIVIAAVVMLAAISHGQMFAQMFGQSFAYVSATGGNVTNYTLDGISYRAHIFTNSGTFTVTAGGSVDYLVVGGGGGGGGRKGAGKGAGRRGARITQEFGIEPGQFKHVGQGLEFCIALQSLRLRFLKYKQKLYFGFRTVSPPASRLTLRDSSITL
jgi:hypothetical protein